MAKSSITNFFKGVAGIGGILSGTAAFPLAAGIAASFVGTDVAKSESNQRRKQETREVDREVSRSRDRLSAQGLQANAQDVKALYSQDYAKVAADYNQRKAKINRGFFTSSFELAANSIASDKNSFLGRLFRSGDR